MKFSGYLRDDIPFLILNLLSMAALSLFLLSAGNTIDTIIIILAVWPAVITVFILIRFYSRKKYLDRLIQNMKELDEKYLLPQIMEKPFREDDKIFYMLLKISSRAMLEKINEVKGNSGEYKEYIEQWLHEVKTPVTAMKLLCENHKSQVSKPLLTELEKLNHYVEQTLYFARSGYPEKDYLVRETNLADIVHQAISQNKNLLLQNHVKIIADHCEAAVFTDEKWIIFILNQLIINAVQYKTKHPALHFKAVQSGDRVVLSIKDNGPGIMESELPRIFDKGFTGTNGRKNRHSTGMGLYICRKLCQRLDVTLSAASDGRTGTEFSLSFYKNCFITIQD